MRISPLLFICMLFCMSSYGIPVNIESICPPGSITPDGDHTSCSYQQKSRKTTILLSGILGWTGAPYFYVGNYALGVFSALSSAAGLGGIVALVRWGDPLNENRYGIGLLCIVAPFIGWFMSIVSVASGSMVDGDGYPLSETEVRNSTSTSASFTTFPPPTTQGRLF